MLKQRIITGLLMVGAFLAAIVYLPVAGLALFFGLAVGLGMWEWSRMSGWNAPLSRAIYVLLLMAGMAALYIYCDLGGAPLQEQVQPFLGLTCLWWSFALLWVKGYPASGALWRSVPMRSLMGAFILVFAWFAAVYLVTLPRGPLLMFLMVAIVAAADIGAYFSGKAFGKHKLAVAVSPNKTWEGFWGGMLACLLLALLVWWQLPEDMDHLNLVAVIAITLITALASVVGDLTVSMVKRESDVKDSGSLLPGHGGVLDRLDSLSAAAPVFALGLLLAGV